MQRLITLIIICVTLSNWLYAQEINIDMATSLSICQGEEVIIGPTSISGGDGDYTYEWTPGTSLSSPTESNPIFFADVIGVQSYELTVRDGVGAEAMATVDITIEPAPQITASVQQPSCGFVGGGIIVITTDVPGAIFLWSDGTTTSSLVSVEPGTYCVTVTSSNGCSSSDCFTIDPLDSPVLTIDGLPTSYCEPITQLNLSATGGVPPYIYNTAFNGIVISTSDVLFDLEDGFYQTTVRDANNCIDIVEYEISQGIRAEISGIPILDCSTGTTTLDIGNSATGPNVVYTWTTPSGIVTDATSIVADTEGEYSLEVSDPTIADCSNTTQVFVTSSDIDDNFWITTSVIGCNQYILSGITIEDYFGIILYNWTLPDGSVSNNLSIIADQAGLYILETSIPGLNCSSINSVFIDLDDSCGSISGTVRLDNNDNCSAEEEEIGVPNIVITATDGTNTYNAITDATGYYNFMVPIGNYTITHSLPSSNWSACQDNYQATVTLGGTEQLNIAVQAEGDCPELSVGLSAPLLRRCFQNHYYLSVCNLGSETATLPEIQVILDEFLIFESASITPSSVDGQDLYFTLNDLVPGACAQILITFVVSCEAELGQTHCTEVYATPDPLCALGGSDWSGANIEITGDCVDDEVIFTIQNTGTADLNTAVNLIVIEDGIAMMNSGQAIPSLPVDGTETFSFPANGATYTATVDQAPGHPYTTTISSSVEGCGTNGQSGISLGFVTQYSQTTATPASIVYCLENTGSYDPNDKAALPKGYGVQQYIEPETEINYRIRFQNTGTDTAFTVVVRDTLSDLLDMSTLRAGNSSHDYQLTISGERVLTFTFDNILLPDSTTNEPASNGFVYYRISPITDAPLESIIENRAAIYFDFNEPVLTNTVFHTLGRDFILTNWVSVPGIELNWKAYPNPVVESVNFVLEGDIPAGNKTIIINDAQGRVVGTYPLVGTQAQLNMGNWPSGWYQLQLIGAEGQLLGQGRIVKN